MNDECCCEQMRQKMTRKFFDADGISRTDNPVYYNEVFDEYGLIIFDGGESYICIHFCPWCGKILPESKREKWFCELEQLGFHDPFSQKIPNHYLSKEWRECCE